MSTCCSRAFQSAADTHFDRKIADRDLKSYRDKGPGVTTRLLRDLIVAAGQANGALLDVGCGIGALTFELLERGMNQAVEDRQTVEVSQFRYLRDEALVETPERASIRAKSNGFVLMRCAQKEIQA